MPVYDVQFYNYDPTVDFPTTTGPFVYLGPSTYAGTASITDNQTGTDGFSLDDDNAGENATVDITISGTTYTGVNTDAEISWILRDPTTGVEFNVVAMEVEIGFSSIMVMLSENPMVAGTTYEVVSYDTLPDNAGDDPGFIYSFFQDGVIDGTSGNDVIDTNYTGDPQGDRVDDGELDGNVVRWDDLNNGQNYVGSSGTLSSGVVDMTFTVTNDGFGTDAYDPTGTGYDTTVYTEGGEVFDPGSSFVLFGDNDTNNDGTPEGTDTFTMELDFAAAAGTTNISDEVYNVTFRINDLDQAPGAFTDEITITAFDASGAPVTVILTPGASQTVSGSTVTGTGSTGATDAAGSLLVEIPGPVSNIVLDYNNLGNNTQAVWLSDVVFDASVINYDDTVNAGDGNDTVLSGLGNDVVQGEGGDDTIDGGAGDDDLYGQSGDDTFVGIEGLDTVVGGETGETNGDTLDLSGETEAVTVNYTANEAGTATNSDGTVTFSEIENIVTTDFDDTVTMPVDGGNADISTGAGDDTVTISGDFSGDTHVDGGAGNDTLELLPDDDRDLVVDMPGENTSDLLVGAQTFTGVENITTGGGDDTITGDGVDNILNAGAGDDTLSGGGGDDTLIGGAGDDTFIGLEDNDTITGGETGETAGIGGGDTVDLSSETDDVTLAFSGPEAGTVSDASGDFNANFAEIENFFLGSGDDTVTGNTGNENVDAGAGDDTMFGGAGNDTLIGGDGADDIWGGTGDDDLTGGADEDTFYFEDNWGTDVVQGSGTTTTGIDNDTLDFSNLTGSVNVNFTGSEDGGASDGVNSVSFDNIEAIRGSNQDDVIDASADGSGLSLEGGGGADTIDGGSGDDVIGGGTGADTIDGGAGADQIDGGTGDDIITAGGGDTIIGGDGDDIIYIDPSQLDTNIITIDGAEGDEDGAGDTLNLSLLGPGLYTPGSIVYTSPDNEDGFVTLTDGTTITFSNIENIICFGRGTRIETPYGPRPIETLKEGDLILTMDHGPQPLRWIGAREVPAMGAHAPIEIAAGALGNTDTLLVSPQHRMLLQDWRAQMLFDTEQVFSAATHLVNDTTIRRREGGTVEYFHMMFDTHQVIFAEGAPTESLYPSIQSVDALEARSREELFAIFPQLRTLPYLEDPTARRCLKGYEAKLLIA